MSPVPPALPASSHDTAPPAAPPTVRGLFVGFLMLGLIAFGGALPLVHRMVVDQRRWLSDEEFTDLLSLCQFLPGGNVINLAVAIGMRFQGVRGALAGLMGLIAAPTLIVIGLGSIYDAFKDDPHVRHLFLGLAAAAAGLLIAMAVRIALPLRRRKPLIAIGAVCFIGVGYFSWPLLPTMLVLSPIGIWVTWRYKL